MQHTIKIKLGTKERLKALGSKDQTYDEIVNEVLDNKKCGTNQ